MMNNSVFWGVILKPEKRYEQVVETSFHVTKACLEPSNAGKVTSVYVEVEGDEFLICSLGSSNLNETLDLSFIQGEPICFRTSGSGTVHLTGCLIEDDASNIYEAESSSEAEEASSGEETIPALVNGNKRKNESLTNSNTKKSKKNNEEAMEIAKAKKLKEILASKMGQSDGDSDDDSDDDDTSDDGILEHTENYAEEEDSEEEDSDDDDGESSDDDDSDEAPAEKFKNTPKNDSKKTPQKTPKADKTPQKTPKTPVSPQKTPKTPSDKNGVKTPKTPAQKRTLKGGIFCEDLKVGNGPEAKRGKTVGMYYEGRLKQTNKRFDSTLSGKPFKFRLGSGEVIKGWDIGLEGIKVGGKRRLTIPANMAYGSQGAPPDIPGNSTLVFEVECKFVN